MNKNIKLSIRTGVVAMAGLLACYSCSDDWDDHYDTGISGNRVNATIYEQMKANSALSNFVEVIDSAGYKPLLDESQIVTVFAPVSGSFNKDSLLSEIANGNKEQVLTRFVKNHIARFNYSANSHEQTVPLLNKKNVTLIEGSVSADSVRVVSDTLCNNGILYVTQTPLPFHPNIYEAMEATAGMDSIYKQFSVYDEDSLDIGRSVYRGVDEDGNRIYVDSVIINTNKLMSRLDAYIQREDSNYMAIIPSNEAYANRINQAKQYFNYNVHEDGRDSLQNYYANYYTLNTLFYNMNTNLHDEDSLVSTVYSKYNPDYYVFYDPYKADGILAPGKYNDKIECSNGIIYTVDSIPTTIYDAFFHDIKLEGEHLGNINTDVNSSGSGIYTRNCTYDARTLTDSTKYSLISNRSYLDVQPSSSSAQPYVAFNVPGNLSGAYDMYVVTVPLKMGTSVGAADSTKAYKFRVNMFYRTNRATDSSSSWPTSRNETLRNPENNSQDFISDTENVDTIFLGTKTFTECYLGASNVGVMMQIQAYVRTSELATYSRRMLIDRILLRPHGMPNDIYQKADDEETVDDGE